MADKDSLYTLKIDFSYDVQQQEQRMPKFMEFKDGKLVYYNMDYAQIVETQKAIGRFSENLTDLGDEAVAGADDKKSDKGNK